MIWLRPAFYWIIKTLAWPVTRIYVRLGVEGAARVPRRGGCIVVANHVSYADPVVLGSACPRRIIFMVAEPIYRLLRLRWFYYMMGTIPVLPDRPDPRAMKAALKTLRDGGAVGIFPEGQRMPDGRLGEGKAGVALLAARSGAPVVPAGILGAHQVMPVGSSFPRPRRVKVLFGEPMNFPLGDGRRPPRERLDGFADQVMGAIAELVGAEAPMVAAPPDTLQRTST